MATRYRAENRGTIRKTVSLSEELVVRLEKIAERKEMSFSYLVEKILTGYSQKLKP